MRSILRHSYDDEEAYNIGALTMLVNNSCANDVLQ